MLGAATAIGFLLLSPFSPSAQADYSEPCSVPQVSESVDVVPPYYDAHVYAATNVGSGDTGVCVRPIGGCFEFGANCYFVGVGVGAGHTDGVPEMTGVLVRPEACTWVKTNNTGELDTCVSGGTVGAEADTSGSVRVCVQLAICQRLT